MIINIYACKYDANYKNLHLISIKNTGILENVYYNMIVK